MYFLLLPFALLPVFEIIGFVVIGGSIGVLWTFLWLAGSTLLGLRLLRGRRRFWEKAQTMPHDEVFVVQGMFDGLCLFIAGILLVFPGFISDFFAVPLLVAPLRHWIFGKMHKGRPPTHGTDATIEAEFRRVDPEDDTTRLR